MRRIIIDFLSSSPLKCNILILGSPVERDQMSAKHDSPTRIQQNIKANLQRPLKFIPSPGDKTVTYIEYCDVRASGGPNRR